jgi:hypothetical protein
MAVIRDRYELEIDTGRADAALGGLKNAVGGFVAALSVLWIVGGAFSFPRVPNAWRREQPSQKQLAYAAKLGLDVPDDISKGDLSDMISSVTGR